MELYKFANCTLGDAQKLASNLSKVVSTQDTICLYGDLGAGKTQFAKLLIKELMANSDVDVTSPTYNIVHTYGMKDSKGEIAHFDLYRLAVESELIELGFEEALDRMLCVIEWPGIAEAYLPKSRIDIYIDFVDADDKLRNIRIESARWLKL